MEYSGTTLFFKQGETFSFSGAVIKASDHTAIDTTNLTAKSQIRHDTPRRELIADLECEWLAGAVLYIHFDEDTTQWPAVNALWDVQLVDEHGQVRVTQTVQMEIQPYVTRT